MIFIYEVILADTGKILTGLISTEAQIDGSERNALANHLRELIGQDVAEKIPDTAFFLKDLRKVA